ncbi:MAG: tetratricopeptide repeat protein [Thermogemmatispora sp.]|uniref:tetratricopeptide repeat protein n=1 Tax=Thermogemmatispora sp. TaxID=1968838 RepID=UPI0019E7C00E|nr:tetratricopeptide repeat protein [Thermogemmatispora sp.]MBE3568018.1 tetratricopeptide repeat protein [Thermogemmatispora sp.]
MEQQQDLPWGRWSWQAPTPFPRPGTPERVLAFLLEELSWGWQAHPASPRAPRPSPWIVWLHDQDQEAEAPAATVAASAAVSPPTGGCGKSTLLRQVLALLRQQHPRLPIVRLDGLDAAAQERFHWARQVVAQLEAAYAPWRADRFHTVWAQLQAEGRLPPVAAGVRRQVLDLDSRARLWAALAQDIAALRPRLPAEGPTLLVVVDHLEQLQPSPQALVLAPGERFPERFGLPRVIALLVSRQPPDWQQPLWRGRQSEIMTVVLPPWSAAEIRQWLAQEGGSQISAAGATAARLRAASERLRELTGGHPALVQLACEQLLQGGLSLEELQRLEPAAFASRLLAQVAALEEPRSWWLLVLAHLQPTAVPVPAWRLLSVLQQLPPFPGQDPPGTGQLLEALASVPGVRLSQHGDDAAGPDADGEPTWIALQPELHQLLRQAWEQLDPDGRFRRALSRAVLSVLSAAEQQAEQALSEAAWQASRLERLHHQLTLDLEEGLRHFQRLFGPATVGWRRSFARTLLETVRECEPLLTSPQRWQLRVWEAQLLRLEEQPALAQQLLERLQQEADPSWLASQEEALSYEFARCALQQNQFLQTIRYYEQCLELARRRGDEEEASTLQGQLGYVYRRLGQWDEALRCYRASLVYHQQRGSRAWAANMLNSIGQVYRLQGRLEEALRSCLVGLRVREELWSQGKLDERAVGLSHSTLALISLESEDLLQAERHFRHAFECYALVGDRTGLAATSNRLGQVALRKGQLEEANTWFKQAEALVTGFDEEVFITSQYYQGRVAAERGRWQEAARHWQCACEHARHVHDRYQLVASLCDLVEALSHLGRHEEAQAAWQEARTIAEEEGYDLLLGRGEEVLGDLALAEKRVEEAFQQYVDSCAWMTHHHFLEYHKAQRRLVERLLSLPLEKVPPTAHLVSESWRQRGLAEQYPELSQACEEILKLLPAPPRWQGHGQEGGP